MNLIVTVAIVLLNLPLLPWHCLGSYLGTPSVATEAIPANLHILSGLNIRLVSLDYICFRF